MRHEPMNQSSLLFSPSGDWPKACRGREEREKMQSFMNGGLERAAKGALALFRTVQKGCSRMCLRPTTRAKVNRRTINDKEEKACDYGSSNECLLGGIG